MPKTIRELVPEYVRSIDPYVPGRPIEEVERQLGTPALKLASNENPLGPSPRGVQAARRALADAHRYPDGGGFYLRQALAERHNVALENIILGAGSTELIDIAARTLLHAGDTGMASAGSFPVYYISTRGTGARLVQVPLRDYAIDLEAMAEAITPQVKIIFLANPNNPTGTMFSAGALDKFLSRIRQELLVVVDEAYFEYVAARDYSRSVEMVRAGRPLLVLRTFSKVYGLAGMRVGYGIGPAELLVEMNKLRTPFNTSSVAQCAALAALEDQEHVRHSVESNRSGLAMLGRGLTQLGVPFVPSAGNFVLVEVGPDVRQVTQGLLSLGVIVRPMAWMGFPQAIRVTVGTAAENERFLAALERVRTSSPLPGAAAERDLRNLSGSGP